VVQFPSEHFGLVLHPEEMHRGGNEIGWCPNGEVAEVKDKDEDKDLIDWRNRQL
jgi:hypothetical protein